MGPILQVKMRRSTIHELKEITKQINDQNRRMGIPGEIDCHEALERCIFNHMSQFVRNVKGKPYMMLELPHAYISMETVTLLITEVEELERDLTQKIQKGEIDKLDKLQEVQYSKNVLLHLACDIGSKKWPEVYDKIEDSWTLSSLFDFKIKRKFKLSASAHRGLEVIMEEKAENSLEQCIEEVIGFEYIRIARRGKQSDIYLPMMEMRKEGVVKIVEHFRQLFHSNEEKKTPLLSEHLLQEEITIGTLYLHLVQILEVISPSV